MVQNKTEDINQGSTGTWRIFEVIEIDDTIFKKEI